MSTKVRIGIRGMTCAHCEGTVAAALGQAGAESPRVDHRRAQAEFEVDSAADLTPYRKAVSEAGYRVVSEEVVPAGTAGTWPLEDSRFGRKEWVGTAALVALPVLCCTLPLLVTVMVTTGAGAWLAAHGSLLAVPVLGLGAGILAWRLVKRRA